MKRATAAAPQKTMPLVSVVMPSFNQVNFLEGAVRSVLEQDYPALELIVADGLSTDGTQTLLTQLAKEYGERLRWFSEQDSGPAQAINRALAIAQGDVIGWLNSDDVYAQGAVARAMRYLSNQASAQWVYGLAQHINSRDVSIGAYPTKPPSTPIGQFADGCFICQPTVFMRRAALDRIGPLNERLQTAFDLDLWLRFFKEFSKKQLGMVNQVQAYSRLHAQCLTQRLRQTVALESMQVIAQHLGPAPAHWLLTYFDELCERYPFVSEKGSLVEIIKTTLAQAKASMEPNTFTQLVKEFQADYRLRLANGQAFVSVEPDGWVSQRMIARLRYDSASKKTLLIRCQGGWSIERPIHLSIRAESGEVEKIKLSSQDEFILTLEASPNASAGFATWLIETRQFFVPAKVQKGSRDTRKLSFRVEGLSVQ